jgi:ribosomal protein L32
MIKAGILALENLVLRYFVQPQLCAIMPSAASSSLKPTVFDDISIWFAVPKQKISHSKKRIKQASKNVFKAKENIVTCIRTGEITLRHKLPFNWKDYIPTFEYTATPRDEK